jgi:hypothetical protein
MNTLEQLNQEILQINSTYLLDFSNESNWVNTVIDFFKSRKSDMLIQLAISSNKVEWTTVNLVVLTNILMKAAPSSEHVLELIHHLLGKMIQLSQYLFNLFTIQLYSGDFI